MSEEETRSISEIARDLTRRLREESPLGKPEPEACIGALDEVTGGNWSFEIQVNLERQHGFQGLVQKAMLLGRDPRAMAVAQLKVPAHEGTIARYGSAVGPDEGQHSIKLLEKNALADAILTLRGRA